MKKWVVYLLSCAITVPAHAQFPIIPLDDEPQEAPKPPADADVALWLKNLTAAKSAAEKAAAAGDIKARDAAIQDAAKWATKVADPYGVKSADVRKAFEDIGELARQMRTWKTDFGKASLVMLEVRADDVIKAAKGADKARLLAYQGDIKIARDLGSLSFEWWEKVLAVPEAEPALVKYAINRAVEYASPSDKSRLKPFYARMLALPLSPAEQTDWKLKQQLFIIDVEYKGEEREAAIAAVKALVDNPQTLPAKRDELARVYMDTLYGEEKDDFIAKMVTTFAPQPQIAAKWIFERGVQQAADKGWAGAVADYRTAAKMLPVGSAERDSYLWTASKLAMMYLGEKQQLTPDFEQLMKSKHLSLDQRFEAAFRLFLIDYDAKDFAKAKTRLATARTIAGDDVLLKGKADIYLARTQNAMGEHEAALTTWKAVDRDKLNYSGQAEIRKGTEFELNPVGMEIYSGAANAKKYTVAQAVLDHAADKMIFVFADQNLLAVDLLARQGKFDEAIVKLKALELIATAPADKTMIANVIAALEKQKADAAAKPAAN